MGPSELRGEQGRVSPMAIATYAAIATLAVGLPMLAEGDGESRRTAPLPEHVEPVKQHRHVDVGLGDVSVDWIRTNPDGTQQVCHTHLPLPGISPIPEPHCGPPIAG